MLILVEDHQDRFRASTTCTKILKVHNLLISHYILATVRPRVNACKLQKLDLQIQAPALKSNIMLHTLISLRI